ncbi:MAG: hypothetical protein EOM31_04210 [Bacteroidia bacterium]|nr:hypothetical protein [Bacteroidia bacterium]
MKLKNIVGILLLGMLSIGFASCSSDDDPIETSQKEELTLTSDALRIVVGSSTEIEIAKGNGDYKAFSLNPEIAEVKSENGKIFVEAKTNGQTAVVLSDQSNQYKKISITSYYETITVDKESLDIKMPIGNPKTKTLEIISGNGSYKATSDNTDILSLSIKQNELSVTGKKEGTATITITDALEVTKTITVVISTTDIPYDEKDLEEIKADATLRYLFASNITENADNRWYTYFNTKENELNLYGWDYYNWQYLKIYFAGDKSVGEKTGAKLTCSLNNDKFTDEPIKFEIIKNDGKKIWATYSFIKKEKLYFGHFCQNIAAE